MIRRKLILGMMVTAWVLYVISLFLPAADLRTNSTTGQGNGICDSGLECLTATWIPFGWIAIYPFAYFMVNFLFLFSSRPFSRKLRSQRHDVYSVLMILSAIATLFAPRFVDAVGPGYFVWSGSVTLAAAAFLVPLNQSATRGLVSPETSTPRDV